MYPILKHLRKNTYYHCDLNAEKLVNGRVSRSLKINSSYLESIRDLFGKDSVLCIPTPLILRMVGSSEYLPLASWVSRKLGC